LARALALDEHAATLRDADAVVHASDARGPRRLRLPAQLAGVEPVDAVERAGAGRWAVGLVAVDVLRAQLRAERRQQAARRCALDPPTTAKVRVVGCRRGLGSARAERLLVLGRGAPLETQRVQIDGCIRDRAPQVLI